MLKPLIPRPVVEIDKPASAHAHMWRNAEGIIHRLDGDLQGLAERQNSYHAELQQIADEREAMHEQRKRLVELLAATHKAVGRATLECEVAAGSEIEADKLAHLEQVQREVTNVEGQIAAHDLDVQIKNASRWQEQEKRLRSFIDEAVREQKSLLAKLEEVRAIHEEAKRANGLEEQASLIEELQAAEAREQEMERELEQVRADRQALQESICQRLAPWKDLSFETVTQHGHVEPCPTRRMLEIWRELVEHLEANAREIDDSYTVRMQLRHVPLVSLRRLPLSENTREKMKDWPEERRWYDINTFDGYMQNLDKAIDELRQIDTQQQADHLYSAAQ